MSLDALTQARIWRGIRPVSAEGLGVVAISHDGDLLDAVADRRVGLAEGRLTPARTTPA